MYVAGQYLPVQKVSTPANYSIMHKQALLLLLYSDPCIPIYGAVGGGHPDVHYCEGGHWISVGITLNDWSFTSISRRKSRRLQT